jgi:hypothetical protein
MGRYLDIAHAIEHYEINEINEKTLTSWDKSTYEKNEINEKSPARSDTSVSGATVLNDAGDPDGLCDTCGSGQWWQLPGEPCHCRSCEPDLPLTATTLTLPCHKVELRPVAAHAGLCTMVQAACQGLTITPEQLGHELEENGDIPDLVSGTLTPKALRLTAETLNTMKYAGRRWHPTHQRTPDAEPCYPCRQTSRASPTRLRAIPKRNRIP